MLVNRKNSVMTLKMSENEKCLAERDYTIKSLDTDMMNSQKNNYILTNQCKNLVEKTKEISYTCLHLNTKFTNICDRMNNLGGTVDNAKTRQHDVTNLVDQTTNTFKEKILNTSINIDDSLKQVNTKNMKAKQELELLENNYSLDMIAYKSNLEECIKEINNLKTEKNSLLDKLKETNLKFNEEREMVLNINKNYEKDLKEKEGQNILLISQNKSLNVKYEEILCINQSLMDEINMIRTSLDENTKQLDMQLTIVTEQMESSDNLELLKQLNNALKIDNFSLKEHNEYLEKNNASLVEDISKINLSLKEIQEKNENKSKDMCKHYNYLMQMQEVKFVEIIKQLQLQIEKESKTQAEMINLKQAIDVSNNTIFNLQEELKTNYILIPELQNKINDLSSDLTNAHQKLQDLDQDYTTKLNTLNNEKIELEYQSKEHFKEIEKLTANYFKYKSKTKQMYVEFQKLRFQCSQSKQYPTLQKISILETIKISSDEDVNMEDDEFSMIECNNKYIPNMDISIQSTSNKMNPKYNYSSLKRNSSPIRQTSNSKVKKLKASVNNVSFRVPDISSKGLKQKIDHQIEDLLNSSFKSINLTLEDKNDIEMKVNNEYNVHNESKNQVKLLSNVGKIKKFKIPDDMKPTKKKFEPKNIQNSD